MLWVLCGIFCSFPIGIICQSWHTKACLNDHLGYIEKLTQETMYKLENDVKFCNLRVDDFNQTINDQMYSWHVSGKVSYTDNFLISMQNVHLEKISSVINRRLSNGSAEYEAGIVATLVFHYVKIGFNVLVELDNHPEQRFTSDYMYNSISFPLSITRHLNKNETIYTTSRAGQAAQLQRMNFLPTSNVTQVLGRNFQSNQISDSFTKWAREIIVPIMQELGETVIPFPTIKLDECK